MTLFDDMASIFVDAFGENALYEDAAIIVSPIGYDGRQVQGIYRAAGMVIGAPDIDAMGNTPLLHLAEADCFDLIDLGLDGARVEIRRGWGDLAYLSYTIVSWEPDGHGMVVCRLQEAD
jgi:hypothetical protein